MPGAREDDLDTLLRVQAARTVLFHTAVAHRAGLNVTDLTCCSLLGVEGPMSTGALAQHLGLTTGGAVTSAVDRLARAGLVERRRDPDDGRRVVVALTDLATDTIAPLYAGFGRRWQTWVAERTTEERDLLARFAAASASELRDAAAELREGGSAQPEAAEA